jgi:DNA invertase Pin-like site-specific DNA recombinase
MMHPKIQPNHLEKMAYLYLRQSSPQQLIDHRESRRVQLQLEDKLYELGFSNVVVIDSDLGKSASGYGYREGFAKILNDVCHECVGAVAAWEASRLARSHFEWQNLIRFCQITGTLVIDEGGVYDPTNIDDIAMLGIKATMCEYELNLLAKRARAGLLQKAQRGDLYSMLPAGYYLTEDGQYEMDPDERVQRTVKLVFDKFQQLGTVRQVLLWFRDERVEFPKVSHRDGIRTIVWELPIYNTLLGVLKNPAYAGAYVYGRRQTRTFIRDGKPVKTSGHPVSMDEWKVLIPDHHRAYISWERFVQNQQQLRENTNRHSPFSKGAPKMGSSLLAGLLSCGHCGRKLSVKYSGRYGRSVRYICRGAFSTTGQTEKCFSTSARRLEEAVIREVLKTVQPAAVSAALEAEKRLSAQCSERQRMLRLELEQARYEAERRERQFNAVEPENRLVIRQLQTLWNEALAKVERLEQELTQEQENQRPLDEEQRQRLYELADALPRLWHLPSTDERTKKRLIRTLIEGIIATAEPESDQNRFIIRWAGSIHSEIRLKRYKRGEHGRKTPQDALEIVKELARITDDRDIARILNRCGLRTATGQSWNQSRVRSLRQANQIPAFSKQSYENADFINLRQAANQLEISPETVLRLIKAGLIQAKQIVRYAPWSIPRSELTKSSVLEAVQSIKKNGKGKTQMNKNQLTL